MAEKRMPHNTDYIQEGSHRSLGSHSKPET